jgi:hypothetical protein
MVDDIRRPYRSALRAVLGAGGLITSGAAARLRRRRDAI